MRANASGSSPGAVNLMLSSCSAVSILRRRARSLDAVGRERDEGRRRRDLAGRQLRQIDRAMPARAGQLDLSGRQLRFDELVRRRERLPPDAASANSTWSFLKSVGLSHASTPFDRRDDGDAELGNLAAVDDGARIRRAREQRGAAGGVGPGRHRDRVRRGDGAPSAARRSAPRRPLSAATPPGSRGSYRRTSPWPRWPLPRR